MVLTSSLANLAAKLVLIPFSWVMGWSREVAAKGRVAVGFAAVRLVFLTAVSG